MKTPRTVGGPLALLLLCALLPVGRAAGQSAAPRVLAWETTLAGTDDLPIRWPVCVAANPDNELAIGDLEGARLLFFTDTGVAWKPGDPVELPATPYSLAHDGERYLLSLRQEPWLVAVEGPNHQLRRVAVPRDVVPGQVAALRAGGFLVHDLSEGRILEVGTGGTVTVKTAIEGRVGALTTTAGGGFYAALPDLAEIRRYDPQGQETDRWTVPGVGPVPAWPVGLLAESSGRVLISDRHGGRLVRLDSIGAVEGVASRRGWSSGLLLFPGPMTRLPDGRIAVVDQGNGRVQIFRRIATEPTP